MPPMDEELRAVSLARLLARGGGKADSPGAGERLDFGFRLSLAQTAHRRFDGHATANALNL